MVLRDSILPSRGSPPSTVMTAAIFPSLTVSVISLWLVAIAMVSGFFSISSWKASSICTSRRSLEECWGLTYMAKKRQSTPPSRMRGMSIWPCSDLSPRVLLGGMGVVSDAMKGGARMRCRMVSLWVSTTREDS